MSQKAKKQPKINKEVKERDLPKEIRDLIIDTSRYSVKKSLTQILDELRYGN